MNAVASNPLLLLGGTYFLNWRNHLAFSIIAILTAIVFDANRLGGQPRDWFLLGLLGIVITVLPLEVLKPILRRFSKIRSIALALSLLAVGFVRGFILYYVGIGMNLVPEEDIVYRFIGGPLFVFFSYLISSSVIEPYLNFRENYRSLREETVRLEQAKASYSKDLLAFNQQQRSRVRELLSPPIWELQKKLEEAEDSAAIREALLKMQALNNDIVRPLSKELAFGPDLSVSIQNNKYQALRALPKTINLGENLPFGFFLLVTSSLGFSSLVTSSASLAGLAIAIVTLTPLLVLLQIERLIFRKRAFATALVIPISIAISFIGGFCSALIGPAIGIETNANFFISAAVYAAIAKLFTIAYSIIQRSWFESLQELAQVSEELKKVNSWLRQRLWLGQKSLAMELHGSVQSTLHAMAARLSKMKHPQKQDLEEVIQSIRDALNRIENQEYLAGGSLIDLLGELKELWDGTAEISWTISPDAQVVVEADLGLARCLFEVIRETVVNSVKHGEATRIEISIEKVDDQLNLLVENDGQLVKGRPGEGEKLFDQICLSHSIEHLENRVIFKGQLSISL